MTPEFRPAGQNSGTSDDDDDDDDKDDHDDNDDIAYIKEYCLDVVRGLNEHVTRALTKSLHNIYMSDSCPLSLNKLNLLYIANSIAWTWSEARTKLLPEHDALKKMNQTDMTDCPGMTK